MPKQTKLIIAGAAAIIVGLIITTLILNHQLRTLDKQITQAKQHADELQTKSHIAEAKSGEYKQKIEYLEGELTAIGKIARRQDEQLKAISGDVGAARRDVERARTIRTIDTTTDELCARLANLGHACEQK
jgi:chromosome segregation ATPase